MATRRQFIGTTSAFAVGIAAKLNALPSGMHNISATPIDLFSEPIDDNRLKAIARRVVEEAQRADATYGDVRIGQEQKLYVSVGAQATVPSISIRTVVGYGIRVLVDGSWAFVHGNSLTEDAVSSLTVDAVRRARGYARATKSQFDLPKAPVAIGRWESPVELAPLEIPILDQADRLGALNMAFARVPKINTGFSGSSLSSSVELRIFASTEGAMTQQVLTQVQPSVSITTLNGISRQFLGLGFQLAGFEVLLSPTLEEEIKAFAEECVEMGRLPVRRMDVGRYPMVLDGSSTADFVAKTLAAGLELDRVLKYEADGVGTSYLAPPDQILGASIVAPEVTIRAHRAMPFAGAVRWDDDGVVPQDVTLIDKGRLVDYMTTRSTVSALSKWYSAHGRPLVSNGFSVSSMPNRAPLAAASQVTMVAGASRVSLSDLIGDVKRGIVLQDALTEPDQALATAQATGNIFEIRNGKIVARLKNCMCEFRTSNLWRSIVGIGDNTTQSTLSKYIYKGRPVQQFSSIISAPAVAFKTVDIVDTGKRF